MAAVSVHLTSNDSNANLRLLQQCLVQINNTPNDVLLQFTVTCDKGADILAQDSKRFIGELARRIPSIRWELLHFEDLGIASVFQPLLCSLQKNAWPNLKHLHLEASGESFYDRQDKVVLNAPFLQYLTLSCLMPISFNETVSSTHFTKLVFLELNNYTTFADILHLLRKSPFLEKCILRMHGDEILPVPRGDVQMVPLPRLRELALISASNLSILYWICTPNLARLQVEMMEILPLLPNVETSSLNQLCHFIQSFCYNTLTHLKLARCPFTDEHILRILTTTPKLTNLCVWWGPTGSVLQALALNSPIGSSRAIRCPKGPSYRGVECFGEQANPHLPLHVPHLTRMKLYVYPLVDQRQQRAMLAENMRLVHQQRRWAFASLLCQAHKPLFDPDRFLPDISTFLVVEPVRRDDDEGKASFIDFGME